MSMRKNTWRDTGRFVTLLAALALVLTVPFAAPKVAEAAASLQRYAFQGVTPRGTTINLFDYWLVNRDTADNTDPYNKYNIGINDGHVLKFRWNGNQNVDADTVTPSSVNEYTGTKKPRQGIVEDSLGDDGYPKLSSGVVSWDQTQESLAYLFDPNVDNKGKQSFENVGGLLQVDGEGYYYYDSTQNYAEFDEGEGNFWLYDAAGVKTNGANARQGQFFPFNEGSEVLQTNQNGELVARNVYSSGELNHYFGMTMSTNFVQQHGGYTDESGSTPVTYNFSGDDDVWVYIDGVLVGDLGGIHGASSLEINFATGNVVVYGDNNNNNKYDPNQDSQYQTTTLKQLFINAGVSTAQFSGNTLGDNTYHTLDFFYLERGGTDSNMSLKYNLVTIPETDITKVDQDINPVAGASFTVSDAETGAEICTAETGSDGSVVLLNDQDMPITVDELASAGHNELTFTETNTPEGYRHSGTVRAYIQSYTPDQTANKEPVNVLLSRNQWETGAYAQPKVTVTASNTINVEKLDTLTDDQKQNGRMFVVIEKNVGEAGSPDWRPIYGDALNGWKTGQNDSVDEIVKAGETTNAVFAIASSGAYQAEVADLPGRIQDYEFFNPKGGGTYRSVYYYSTASSWSAMNDSNTYQITNSDDFDRQFSANLYISNTLNRIILQKVDESGDPVNGATMALYSENDVTIDPQTGEVTLSGSAVKSGKTETLSKENGDKIDLEGAVVFDHLIPGTYYAVETDAPDGFIKTEDVAKVFVTESGVYADAGSADDDITVTRGIGRVVGSMLQFAAKDDVDTTLHNVTATPVVATGEPGNWTQTGEAFDLQYADDGDAVLDYEPTTEGGPLSFTVDSGIPSLTIKQSDNVLPNAQDLDDQDLTNLFTGSTIVTFKNERAASLEITKELVKDSTLTGPAADTRYQMNVELTFPEEVTPADLSLKAQVFDAEGNPTSDLFSVDLSEETDEGTYIYGQAIKAGETIRVYGLPEGTRYTVTEDTTGHPLPAGVTLSSIAKIEGQTSDEDVNSETGTIENASVDAAHVVVTNAYIPDSVSLSEDTNDALAVTKTVTGASAAEDFTFSLALDESNEGPADGVTLTGNSVTISKDKLKLAEGESEATATESFGTVTFSKVGTYTFVIDETNERVPNGGWTYDAGTCKVKVTVGNDYETGSLKIEDVQYFDHEGNEAQSAVFTNTYKAQPVVIGGEDSQSALKVTKSVVGAPAESEYTFKLTTDDATDVKEVDGDQTVDFPENGIDVSTTDMTGKLGTQTVNFPALSFAEEGVYTFQVEETKKAPNDNWTYDNTGKTITVTVTDPNNDGQLDATTVLDGQDTNNPTIVNTYFDADDAKQVTTETGDGSMASVGDTLTYTVNWVNNAVDQNGAPTAATVVVTDAVPKNTTLVAGSISSTPSTEADQNGDQIVWTFENQEPGATGSVTFQVTVDQEAAGTTVTNTAGITIGDNPSVDTNATETFIPGKDVEGGASDGGIKVGDILTYTISYKNPYGTDQTVEITDTLPAGLTFDEMSEGQPAPSISGQTLTWEIETKADTEGTLTFTARVNESAMTENIGNTAYITIGENEYHTNTTPEVTVGSGNLTISKSVELVSGQGTQIDLKKEFSFTVNLKDASGNALDGEYEFSGTSDGATEYKGSVSDGETITLKHNGSVTITGLPEGACYIVTEVDAGDGYTQTAPVNNEGKAIPAKGSIVSGASETAAFTNSYDTDPAVVSDGTSEAFDLTKQLTGRAWNDTDEFSFTLTAGTMTDLDENAVEGGTVPMPAGTENGAKTVSVTKDDADENGIAPINFGDISYDRTGIYTYTVTEQNAGSIIDGVTYANNTVGITVTVTDNGTGGLVATVSKSNEMFDEEGNGASFVNVYDSTFVYGADGKGGLDITKQLNGRDAAAGQFTFTIEAEDDAAAAKLKGIEEGKKTVEVASAASEMGVAAPVANNPFDGMTFSLKDSGKTFTYTISENDSDNPPAGYSYDTDEFTVNIKPVDNGDGTMSVTTEVTNGSDYSEMADSAQRATVPFVNSYAVDPGTIGVDGDTTIVAHKTLKNDTLATHQFNFVVTDVNNSAQVAQGTNDADGNIAFSDIVYTTDELNAAATADGSQEIGKAAFTATETGDVYTFTYRVSESVVDGTTGVSYVTGDQNITVKVTDDRAGNLSIAIDYGNDASGIEFVNEYGAGNDGKKSIYLEGNKIISGVDGAVPPKLTGGDFTFKLTGLDGAPMPEGAAVDNTISVTNDSAGNIKFGPIEFSIPDAFGEEDGAATGDGDGVEAYTAGRIETYTYEIDETGGSLPGVTNDNSVKTVKVTVTDLGNGKVDVEVTPATGASIDSDFTFKNTYRVESKNSTPTADGALSFTKVWDRQGGTREMSAGEFTFQMTDDKGNVVSTGTNDANGNIAMSQIEFKQEGTYSYKLSEVVPEGAAAVEGGYMLDGVLYPDTTYAVTAKVSDNHDGTLSVAWSLLDQSGKEATKAEFVNTYSVKNTSVTFGASKSLEGREVADGEFTFELKDADGKVLGTATNDATGKIVFGDAVQSFGAAGEYDFTISEVLPEDDDPAKAGIQKDNVTYDETVYTAHVVVSDDLKGNLKVTELTYNDEAALPNFVNTYVEPPAPAEPGEPAETIPATGDAALLAVAATAGIGSVLAVAGYVTSKKRGE